eukprot:6127069-Pyramimonas_sp.AAC.1
MGDGNTPGRVHYWRQAEAQWHTEDNGSVNQLPRAQRPGAVPRDDVVDRCAVSEPLAARRGRGVAQVVCDHSAVASASQVNVCLGRSYVASAVLATFERTKEVSPIA